jgi:hypothetical protein
LAGDPFPTQEGNFLSVKVKLASQKLAAEKVAAQKGGCRKSCLGENDEPKADEPSKARREGSVTRPSNPSTKSLPRSSEIEGAEAQRRLGSKSYQKEQKGVTGKSAARGGHD